MLTLLLANTDSPILFGGGRPNKEPAKFAVVARRLAWMLRAGDVMVVPGGVDPAFLDYMADLTGVAPSSIRILDRNRFGSGSWAPEELPDLAAQLREIIEADPFHWAITGYIQDRDLAAWGETLGIRQAGPIDPWRQDSATLTNSKSVFRALAHDLPIAEGRVVWHGPELIRAVTELLPNTGSVIVKEDFNSGGRGNLLITRNPELVPRGAINVAVVKTGSYAEIKEALTSVGAGIAPTIVPGTVAAAVIVEVYEPNSETLYAELDVPINGPVRLISHGLMRMRPLWNGFEIPTQGLTSNETTQFLDVARELATRSRVFGHHGLINVDFVHTSDGRVLATEINGRAGGCTHFEPLARIVDIRDRVLLTGNGEAVPNFPDLLTLLSLHGLNYNPAQRIGVVVVVDDTYHSGTIEYAVVERDSERAAALELTFLQLAAAAEAAPTSSTPVGKAAAVLR